MVSVKFDFWVFDFYYRFFLEFILFLQRLKYLSPLPSSPSWLNHPFPRFTIFFQEQFQGRFTVLFSISVHTVHHPWKLPQPWSLVGTLFIHHVGPRVWCLVGPHFSLPVFAHGTTRNSVFHHFSNMHQQPTHTVGNHTATVAQGPSTYPIGFFFFSWSMGPIVDAILLQQSLGSIFFKILSSI